MARQAIFVICRLLPSPVQGLSGVVFFVGSKAVSGHSSKRKREIVDKPAIQRCTFAFVGVLSQSWRFR